MPVSKEQLDSLRIDRDGPPPPQRTARRWPVVLLAIVLIGATAGGALWWRAGTDLLLVETALARRAAGAAQSSVLNASGYVVARRIATISSKVTGKIAEVLVEEGMTVTAGQVLARLDDSTVRAEFALAESSLQAARNQIAEIEVRLAEARRNLDRARSLREQALVSEADLDAARAEVDALDARLSARRSDVSVAESTLAVRQQALDDLVIRAPFEGVVISKDAQPGEMISPVSAGGGFTRTGICTVVDMDSREIEVDVNEAYINRVSPGQRTVAQLDAYSDWEIPSRVINIVPTADRQRATVRVRIAFDQLDARVLPDMGVRVRFLEDVEQAPPDTPAAVAVIPGSALRRDGDTDLVWVVRDGMLERRAVSVGRELAQDVELLAGLAPGESVVTSGPAGLAPGLRVRVAAAPTQ